VQETLKQFRLPAPRRVVDLGCGPGKQVALLARAFPDADTVVGVDSSANMLAVARTNIDKLSAADTDADAAGGKKKKLSERVSFVQASFEDFTSPADQPLDLLYSNAALHWSKTHATLFPHLVRQVRSDGRGLLAIQMPNNFAAPSHTCIRQTLEQGAFFDGSKEQVDAVCAQGPSIHPDGASHYWHLLAPHCRHVDAWQTEYQQLIASSTPYHPVAEWTKSTALAPVLAALPSDEERTRFMQLYSELLEVHYPYFERAFGGGGEGEEKRMQRVVLFPFKRVFLVAIR
jgi:trans-aconitate 2-methyltransferase